MNNNDWEDETLLRIRREFSEKEKYNILMDDYFEMIKKLTYMDELEQKYFSLKNSINDYNQNIQNLKINTMQTAVEWLIVRIINDHNKNALTRNFPNKIENN